jgi:hypothetical protein
MASFFAIRILSSWLNSARMSAWLMPGQNEQPPASFDPEDSQFPGNCQSASPDQGWFFCWIGQLDSRSFPDRGG